MVGHADVRATLQRAMSHDRPGHAYLFFGPSGVGKTTMALAFVQALFCQTRSQTSSQTGCGHCMACCKVAQNNHCDLVRVEMMEGKTRIGIDQIRDLAGFLSLTPMESPWKAAIIEDAASMNEAAANALLKTLEEPPDHSLLILVTRQMGRLLPTIRSRCLKSRFSPLSEDALRRILTTITPLDKDAITDALGLGGGDLGRILALSQGELSELRKDFRKEMTTLPSATLGQVSTLAERWSTPETFSLVVMLLRAWFQERIHASVVPNSGPVTGEAWLHVILWSEHMLRQAAIVNLNRRLVLEAVFIRLARVQGASY